MPAEMVLLVLLALTTTLAVGGETGNPISKPGCPDSCGNMSIPYPFGIGEHCSLGRTFLITCNETSNEAFQGKGDVQVKEIMLLSGESRFMLFTAHLCRSNGNIISNTWASFDGGSIFTLSHTKNKFTVVGCDATAYVDDSKGNKFRTGCSTGCGSIQDAVNGSCDGIGCCQISVPRRIKALNITLASYGNHSETSDEFNSSFNPCNSAFVVEQAAYNFSSLDFMFPSSTEKPAIFDWAIGSTNCSEAKNQAGYVCGGNSTCLDYDNGPGYRCNCSDGYRGNPYLPDGCQDIDECNPNTHCIEQCHNSEGSFTCDPCRKGYNGDGYTNGTGCLRIPVPPSDKILRIALGTSISIIAILLLGGGIYLIFQKRKLNQLRKKHYKENGGFTLQQLLSQHERQINSFKIYTADELNKATHSYDEGKILGKGGQGTVYKGELVDNTIVAIKKSNVIDKSQVDNFVNEIVILSQTNHRNVVKLLGCCLETEIPMLVYEFITNGTLLDYLQKDRTPQMPWHTRIRIAAETAGAISYLHSAAAIPIIHRDIKTANILLDVGYTAKVSDFGVSKFASADKTSLVTNVVGTLGYLDPEYYASGILTEKSDVYSFGIVLLELLTGAKPIDKESIEAEKSLSFHFMSCMKEGRLYDIVDNNLKRNVKGTQLEEVASMAARCLNERGEDRPSMKEVASVLEKVAKREIDHPWVAIDLNDEQETRLLIHGPVPSNGASNATSGNGYPDSV